MSRLDEILEDLLNENEPELSLAACDTLAAEATADWLPRLHELLTVEGDFYLREAAAVPVARLEGIGSLSRLLAVFRMGIAENHDNDGLTELICSLVESHPLDAAPILIGLASSPDAGDRADAAWLSDNIPEHFDLNLVMKLAHDDFSAVRAAAYGSLGSYVSFQEAFDCLISGLRDPAEEARIAATSALGYSGDSRALPELIRCQPGTSPKHRQFLDDAIERLENGRAT